jgi:TonB family protein
MLEPDTEQKPSRRLWVFAAVGALALHLGCGALAFAHLRGDDGGGDLGAQGIEVGLELTSARADPSDLPVGPDTDASVASPAIAEQEAVQKPTDLPKEMPKESDDPDRIVSPTDSKKPVKDDTKLAAVQTSASEESAAQEATARQVFESAKESDTPTVVHQGIGKDAHQLAAEWGQQLSAYFKNHQVYPDVQKTKSVKVKVAIVLNRLGRVLNVAVLESSGDRLYDEAAMAMIRRSDPVPRPPAKLTDEQFNYALDVSFDKSKEKSK